MPLGEPLLALDKQIVKLRKPLKNEFFPILALFLAGFGYFVVFFGFLPHEGPEQSVYPEFFPILDLFWPVFMVILQNPGRFSENPRLFMVIIRKSWGIY